MGFTCGMNGGKEKYVLGLVEKPKEGDYLKDRLKHTENTKIDLEKKR
jgi:hypothetical protein